jgi:serine/threonine protein kinase
VECFAHTLAIPESASDALRELLEEMLEPNPAKRMSLQEVEQHRFFHHSPTEFVLPVRTPPKLNPGRAISYVVAKVCDEEYTFVKRQLSASSPVSLYGYF